MAKRELSNRALSSPVVDVNLDLIICQSRLGSRPAPTHEQWRRSSAFSWSAIPLQRQCPALEAMEVISRL